MDEGPSQQPLPLYDLLENADLLHYYDAFKDVLKLRHAADLYYTDCEDLDRVRMSRPEQKRLFREYAKHFPVGKEDSNNNNEGFMCKIKRKVFGGSGRASKQDGRSGNENADDIQHLQTGNNSQHIIPAERITLCKEIGSGEFGCVFQAAWYKDWPSGRATQVAVKRVLPEKLISQPSSFLQEAAIMVRMQHENVIRLFGVVLDTKAVMLVSELASCGSLLECLQNTSNAHREPAFSISTICDFALQIGRGMRYLSSQRLIHRDLAARNVLVCSPTKVKISDFGLSRSLGHGEDYYRSEFNPSMKLPISWCSPESINFLRFTTASDVWAYGVCLWEMFSYGKPPWQNMTGIQILHAIDTQRQKLERPEACPTDIYALMLRCWEWESGNRPNFEDICDQLPSLFPPLLLTVVECRTRREGHLQYEKGELIVLLDKSTATFPAFWLGSTRSGKSGLFRPEDTIAYLGAENPSLTSSNGEICTIIHHEKEMPTKTTVVEQQQKRKKIKFVKEKQQRKEEHKKTVEKLKIGAPQGDLRHTCHVGADGRTFGLLNLDKNDLPRSLPPRIPSPRTNSPEEMLPIMYSSTISLAPPRPPKSTATLDSMSRSFCLESPVPFAVTSSSVHNSPTQPTPPVLPPKPPRFRARPGQTCYSSPFQNADITVQYQQMAGSENYFNNSNNGKKTQTQEMMAMKENRIITSSPFPLDYGEERRMSPTLGNEPQNEHICEKQILEEETEKDEDKEQKEEFLRPNSICLEQLSPTIRKRTKMSIKLEEDKEDEEQILQILTSLQRDLSDFSLSTLDDSDGQPLLLEKRREERMEMDQKKAKNRTMENTDPAARTSMVFGMEPEEFVKRAEQERRHTSKQLDKLDDSKRASTGSFLMSQSPTAIKKLLTGSNDSKQLEELPRSKKEPLANWSPEADQAYKLLVQCGKRLKSGQGLTVDNPGTHRTPSPKEVIPLVIPNPMVNVKENGAKKVEYLNSQHMDQINYNNGPEESSSIPISTPFPADYVNTAVNSVTATKPKPPPVPPKPKMKINFCTTNNNTLFP